MSCTHVKTVDTESYTLAVRLSLALSSQNTDYDPHCSTCGTSGTFCCLECSHIGCLAHAPHSTHAMAVCLFDSSQGFLWCTQCRRFIVSPATESIRCGEIAKVLDAGPPAPKIENPEHPPHHARLGLRGFYNMGATCYMAVVLQTLIHNPFVSSFFLSGGHNRFSCTRPSCIQCCIDEIYSEFFSGESKESCGLPDLLYSVVKASSAVFSGASEQDAHEFLQFMLDQFHQTHLNTVAAPDKDCSCITHRTFAGSLESKLVCSNCQFEKTLSDALVDISLEVFPTLEECLAQFTAPEKLGSYECNACGKPGGVSKQICIEKLPPVLQIQLKRFKHVGYSAKVESHVDFPLELDVSPYTKTPAGRPFIYELFGVLCHYGTLDTGHYTCMMKHSSGVWYQFDDTMVYPIRPSKVLQASAYLLFYCIKTI